MDNIHKNIDKYNPSKQKFLAVFDVMIVDMPSKKHNLVVTQVFIRGGILNISLALSINLVLLFQKILD